MAVSFVSANAAYQTAGRIGGESSIAQAGTPAPATANFGDVLADTVKEALGTMRAGETAAGSAPSRKNTVAPSHTAALTRPTNLSSPITSKS